MTSKKETKKTKAVVKKAEIEPLNVEKLESQVIDMVKFDVLKSDLEKMVEESSKVKYDITKDEDVEKAKKKKLEIRKTEIVIEKNGKSFRKVFRNILDIISSKEKELTSITNPEVERLKKIEEEAKEYRIKKEREEKLPVRIKRLEEIEPIEDLEAEKEKLMKMDSQEFESYYNQRVQEKLEREKRELEEKLEKERLEREAEIERQRKELEEERKRLEEEKAKLAQQNQPQQPPAEDITGAEQFEQIVNEQLGENNEQVGANNEQPSENTGEDRRERYKRFLLENGYTKETAKDFIQRQNENGEWELFKKIATFKG